MKKQILYRDEKGRYVSGKNQTDLKDADEQVEKKIAEYLDKNAWMEDDEPKQNKEETHIKFSTGINIGILVTAILVWFLLTVLILYVGMRI
jgi:hypothetical protein